MARPSSDAKTHTCERTSRRIKLPLLLPAVTICLFALQLLYPVSGESRPQTGDAEPLQSHLVAVLQRPEFKQWTFGIEFLDPKTGKIVFESGANNAFPSTAISPVVAEGAGLALLGAPYRVHTYLYRTGPMDHSGILHGNLVMVAGGDPNLSGRVQADGTLAFRNDEQTLGDLPGSAPPPGDPLAVIRKLAASAVAQGLRKLDGRVLVDDSMFPVVLNDNEITVIVTPGNAVGTPASLKVSPETSYARFVNEVKTSADLQPASNTGTTSALRNESVRFTSDRATADGSRHIVVSGALAANAKPALLVYRVPEPARFAEMALAGALRHLGIPAEPRLRGSKPDFDALDSSYTFQNWLGEHISLPFEEDVKVALKINQTTHAGVVPFLVADKAEKKDTDLRRSGLDLMRDFLIKKAGVSPRSPQSPSAAAALPVDTPDAMARYLAAMTKVPDFSVFFGALPVLGRDGVLWNVQPDSPAAAKLHAVVETLMAPARGRTTPQPYGKCLAGYLTTVSGQQLAFAIYVAPSAGTTAAAKVSVAQTQKGTTANQLSDATAQVDAAVQIASAAYEAVTR